MAFVLVAACGSKENNNDNNDNNDPENNVENEPVNNEENNNSQNENEEPENNDENNENESFNENENNNENEAENNESTSFADEIYEQRVTEILLDLEEVDLAEDILIEHDKKRYIEQEYVTGLLDYEITFDEDNNLLEIFEGKGDFEYTPNHTEDGGAMMNMSQIYDERVDDYIDTGEEAEHYKLIEYDDKLYLPVRFVNMFMETPVHYKRRDGIVEFGQASEKINIHDYVVQNGLDGHAAATESADDVTIEGKNHEKAIKIEKINSATSELYTNLYGQYSTAEGFIYNKSKDKELTVYIGPNSDNIVEEVTIEPREAYDYKIDTAGYGSFYMNILTEPGSDETAIIVGDFY